MEPTGPFPWQFFQVSDQLQLILHSKPVSPATLGHRAELPKVQATGLLFQLTMLLGVSFFHSVGLLLTHSLTLQVFVGFIFGQGCRDSEHRLFLQEHVAQWEDRQLNVRTRAQLCGRQKACPGCSGGAGALWERLAIKRRLQGWGWVAGSKSSACTSVEA